MDSGTAPPFGSAPPSDGLDLGNFLSQPLENRWFRALYETPLLFSGILDTDGRVLDGNRLAIEGCGLNRDLVLGTRFWDCGWWNRDAVIAGTVRRWCEQAIAPRQAFRTTSPYFLGNGDRRMVDLSLSPVEDDAGGTFLVAMGSDITEAYDSQVQREQRLTAETRLLRQEARSQADQLDAVRVAGRRADERLGRLAAVALDLVHAETVADLISVLTARGFPVLGADGGSIVVRERDTLQAASSPDLAPLHVDVAQRIDSPMPVAHVARSGSWLALPNQRAGLAFTTGMADVYDRTGRSAWAFAPLTIGEQVLGVLVVAWTEDHAVDEDERSLIEAFAAQCAQALERIRATSAEREAAGKVRRLAESLQRSLLAQPPPTPGLQIAVGYHPAADEAQVGGDWYDAFPVSDGTTALVIGDVAGHDRDAAAAMSQVRNLLRGIAYELSGSPARVLSRLDNALFDMSLATLATAVVATLETTEPAGQHVLHWSSAGHLPPLVISPDGPVLLARAADLLLGMDVTTTRHDHRHPLAPGSTVVLYTDGLIERRNSSIDDGMAWLLELARGVGDLDPEQLCEFLLNAVPRPVEDDVAVLAVRIPG